MRYVGITPQGTELELPRPLSARLRMDEDAPAHSFSGVFPGILPALAGLKLFDGGRLRFDGLADRQIQSRDSAGLACTLDFRSREALLLDNEAVPSVYRLPSLPMLVQALCSPYGFSEFCGPVGAFNQAFTVTKGMSAWAALARFCRLYLGGGLWAADGTLYAGEKPPHGSLLFGAALPYSALRIIQDRSKRYSKLLVRSPGFEGYGGALEDAEALSLGISRTRCISEEWEGQAMERLEQSRRATYRVEITRPGGICASLLDCATVDDPALGLLESLTVCSLDYRLTNQGETCKISMRKD